MQAPPPSHAFLGYNKDLLRLSPCPVGGFVGLPLPEVVFSKQNNAVDWKGPSCKGRSLKSKKTKTFHQRSTMGDHQESGQTVRKIQGTNTSSSPPSLL